MLCIIQKQNGGNYEERLSVSFACSAKVPQTIWISTGKISSTLWVKPEHIAWHKNYLRLIRENRRQPLNEKLLEVYTDDPYIHYHHHHQLIHANLYHSEDELE